MTPGQRSLLKARPCPGLGVAWVEGHGQDMEEREQQKTTPQSGSAAINLRGLERKGSAFAVALQSRERPTSRLGGLFPATERQGGWSRRLLSVNERTNHRCLQTGARAKAPINDNDSESVSPFPCWRAGGRTGRSAVIHWDSSVVGQKGVRRTRVDACGLVIG